ncbi:MAG: amino acid ABC transporter permease [Hyphomicrobiales bacterium]
MKYHINYNFVWLYFDKFYWGLLLGIELAVISILIGSAIGLSMALVYVDGPRSLRRVITGYVEFIRNQPLLLLVYLVFYGIPTIGGFKYDNVTSFIITLSVYSGAYLVEIFRAGLEAVPRGLQDAGKAIGLTPRQRLLHVRLPTMFRVVMPALSNQFVSLFKDTSIASVLAVPELTYAAKWLSTNKFRVIEAYSIAAPLYIITGYLIFAALRLLERKFSVRR